MSAPVDSTMPNRTAREIAIDMDKLAPRRANINTLRGAKLIAYKRLELEFADAKFAEPKSYQPVSEIVLKYRTIPARTADDMRREAEARHAQSQAALASEISNLEAALCGK